MQSCCYKIKLNKKKAKDIIIQIKRDDDALKPLTNKKIIHIGIINSYISKYDYKNQLKDINCIILGIKHSIFCKRKITLHLDWPSISQIKKIQNDIKTLQDELREIKEEI